MGSTKKKNINRLAQKKGKKEIFHRGNLLEDLIRNAERPRILVKRASRRKKKTYPNKTLGERKLKARRKRGLKKNFKAQSSATASSELEMFAKKAKIKGTEEKKKPTRKSRKKHAKKKRKSLKKGTGGGNLKRRIPRIWNHKGKRGDNANGNQPAIEPEGRGKQWGKEMMHRVIVT